MPLCATEIRCGSSVFFQCATLQDNWRPVLPEGTEMVMPGDNIKMKVQLINPIAMEEGLRFAIREGGRTVGAGVVAKILK